MPAMTSVITIASASSRRSMASDSGGTHCICVVRSPPSRTAGICAAAQAVVAAGSRASTITRPGPTPDRAPAQISATSR